MILDYVETYGPLEETERPPPQKEEPEEKDKIKVIHSNEYLSSVQERVTVIEHSMHTRRKSKAEKCSQAAQNVQR